MQTSISENGDDTLAPTRHDESATPPIDWDHSVQFYETDDFLCDSVADFLSDGLLVGDPLVVVATRAHRDGLIERMGEDGLGWGAAERAGRLRWMDAHAVLEMIMVDRVPDPARFDACIGQPIRASGKDGGPGRVRAYGELVDLLWREGFADAALDLEALWNDLGRGGDVSLLCAYSRGNFYREATGNRVRQVCDVHARVLPGEGERLSGP